MTQSNAASPSRFSRWLSNFLRGLFRLLLVIIIGALIGGAVYLGGTFLYNQFQGAQLATAQRLSVLETGQASISTRSEENTSGFQERITALEQQQALDRENFSSLGGNLESLQQEVENQTKSLKKLSALEAEISKLAGLMSYEATQTTGMQMTQSSPDVSLRTLRSEIRILRAMQLLNRARLFFLQSNYGLAAGDLKAARDELQILRGEVPAHQQETVAAWIDRLERSLASLPASPVQAASDLDMAWEQIASGLPVEPTLLPEGTPTPASTAVKTLTPTPK
ncbi:MAG: hypothetical protein IT308_00630 [Anaerolineaceae bacterium]|nr:hypothetical protein [Anaerolineaceae bacterium]